MNIIKIRLFLKIITGNVKNKFSIEVINTIWLIFEMECSGVKRENF